MRKLLRGLLIVSTFLPATGVLAAPIRFTVQLPATGGPFTGRLIVCLQKPDTEDSERRPCTELDETYRSQQGFAIELNNATAGSTVVLDDSAFGYPVRKLSEIAAGEYRVEAVLNVYEEFHLADGRTLWLPPDRGEGQQWSRKPGNPASKVQTVRIAQSSGDIAFRLDQTLPPLPAPEPDTKYLKHITIHSAMLSKFWGRDVNIGAMVLLPAGFAEHPDAHYPLVVWQDHFQAKFRAPAPWRETPPDPKATGRAAFAQAWEYRVYSDWVNGVLPHVILVVLNHANPYYDDSYAVNSANVGPYGDAITQEVIPEIERRYRGIGQGWARGTLGGSTGGWEALAQQIFYPDFYNGAWGLCPDPVDFHAYQVTNLYDDTNAYFRSGPFGTVPIPADREHDGDITATMEGANHYEYLLGTRGRSTEQFDIWQAVFSPPGPDGYPRPVYDKLNGTIDKTTVQYWHDHYDLDAILIRDWATLGPKLEGKLHLAVGLNDTYYLDTAVHLMEENLKKTQNPHSDATFDYGIWEPHCYTGKLPDWDESRGLDALDRILPPMVAHMLATAPPAADTKSWRY